MIIDTTKQQMEQDFHPDCCECPKCLHEFYNPVYKILLSKAIGGCVCSCGSVDFGMIADGITTRYGSSVVCKQCNRWEYV